VYTHKHTHTHKHTSRFTEAASKDGIDIQPEPWYIGPPNENNFEPFVCLRLCVFVCVLSGVGASYIGRPICVCVPCRHPSGAL
jgi:hypothetical protein